MNYGGYDLMAAAARTMIGLLGSRETKDDDLTRT